ncbi:hypothetical protein G7B40_039595 [Aetokthonos hydrillicola Thurmond2011]|jgi:fluoride ion exporter CrcB/FEX|uniref:Uncharacterized protein n=1 Tax=Aetokthonos hydrillicola Thurmond2011 TaxID=2712845 RepID=A0AAP5IF59_9CYAN|nr:hypothetical protein [Aetokthonos hydrillicola]MBO3463665.1 hypothetical protein [Aetokthonos hydrillicola CCALA 1050]MBW4590015.1 hypothetical protein [Aetokthonos hydrillicola CCALA 1050]MDR9900596.1 hypothetical protein [Aetokthonos hydrillicola Thurmond2011]
MTTFFFYFVREWIYVYLLMNLFIVGVPALLGLGHITLSQVLENVKFFFPFIGSLTTLSALAYAFIRTSNEKYTKLLDCYVAGYLLSVIIVVFFALFGTSSLLTQTIVVTLQIYLLTPFFLLPSFLVRNFIPILRFYSDLQDAGFSYSQLPYEKKRKTDKRKFIKREMRLKGWKQKDDD